MIRTKSYALTFKPTKPANGGKAVLDVHIVPPPLVSKQVRRIELNG